MYLPINEADICKHEIIIHIIKVMHWYTTETKCRIQSIEVLNKILSGKHQAEFLNVIMRNNLSDSKTKCWLAGSISAFAKSLFSASTMENLPQTTCIILITSTQIHLHNNVNRSRN